jgi:pyrroloquinoline quinone biosynthesis protein B
VIRILVLGAGAGGGFPQWNSNSEASRRARRGDLAARPTTQASIALSADGMCWFLVNAALDLREQINANLALHPRDVLRSSPIAGIVLTNGDVDAVGGLLHLRERTAFKIFANKRIFGVLDCNPIFKVLAPDIVTREELVAGQKTILAGPNGADSGLRVTPFVVPGKIPLFMEDAAKGGGFGTEDGDTMGLEITSRESAARILYIANCAMVDDSVRRRCAGASLLFFDGTLWRDDEMIASGEGMKTGKRMGHISMSGPEGSIAALADLEIGRRVFIHINNTNPTLLNDSAERAAVEAAGWEIARDGLALEVR